MYTAGYAKEYVRDDVFLFLMDCTNILTLPNLYFNLEKLFIRYGKNVECAERDESIYTQQLEIMPEEIKLHLGDVCNLDLSNYDGLFLDMCGPFSNSVADSLIKLKPGTKVAVTLLLARECKNLQRSIDINNREDSYIELFRKFNVEITKCITYCATSSMGVFFGTKK